MAKVETHQVTFTTKQLATCEEGIAALLKECKGDKPRQNYVRRVADHVKLTRRKIERTEVSAE